MPLRQFEDAAGRRAPKSSCSSCGSTPTKGSTSYRGRPPRSASAIGTKCSEGQIVEVTVTGSNKGGLECQVAGIRGFIPMGQVSIYRVENPEEFVGQRLACVVTEANRDRRNLVLSHRAVMERERNELRDKLLAELAPGQIREGIVRSLKDFGAFVDLGGVDGLIHVSQLSWDRVKHPSEVLEVGQKVKVRIEKFDKDTGKVSLSYREVGDNPWQNVDSEVFRRRAGDGHRLAAHGVRRVREARAGRRRADSHFRAGARPRVSHRATCVSEGQEVEVKMLSVDAEKQRISLSLKALHGPARKAGRAESRRRRHAAAGRRPEAAAQEARATQRRHRRPQRRREVRAELVSVRSALRGKYRRDV